MESRLTEYRSLLDGFLDDGYAALSLDDTVSRLRSGAGLPARTLIVRHDVDSDPVTAEAMLEVESALNLRTSYYFRLTTWDAALARRIAANGSEVGYHFEEIATIAKKRALATREAIVAVFPEIRQSFAENLRRLRSESGLPMRIVCAHGDFVNRKLAMYNQELLTPALRQQLQIAAETYDSDLTSLPTYRISDAHLPLRWRGLSPAEARSAELKRRESLVYLLIHPRHWTARWEVGLSDLARRVHEGVVYAVRSKRGGKPT